MACDEKVVRDMDLEERKAYSSALLRCSARKIHLAAMPVAFGEVSVKERIRSVLNCRKPGFWISLAAVTCGDSFFLEQLVDERWVEVSPSVTAPMEPTDLATGSRLTLSWEDTYGSLGPGYYRIGSFYTFRSGEIQDTQVCYAKFRLYDPNAGTPLEQCRTALEALLTSERYRAFNTEYMPYDADQADSHYFTTEIWKSGSDQMTENRYYYYRDGSPKGAKGLLRRDGTYYDLTWAEGSSRNAVVSWNTNTYAAQSNFEIWAWGYTIYDSIVSQVNVQEDTIQVVMEQNPEEGLYTHLYYTFDGDALKGIKRIQYDAKTQTEILDAEMEVLSTDPQAIHDHIRGQDLSAVAAFSYAEDQAQYSADLYIIQTEGFVNTAPAAAAGAEQAAQRAMAECTLPAAAGLDLGFNKTTVCYDSEAGMWKVEFTASWDDEIYQAVYMDNQGLTRMTVTRK